MPEAWGFEGQPIVYDGTEPVAIDAQAGKGKLTRSLGVNLFSPRTAHLTKVVTDPKNDEVAWISWKTLERQGYRVRFINTHMLHGYRSETYNFNTAPGRGCEESEAPPLVQDAAMDVASYHVPVDHDTANRWVGQGVRTAAALYLKIAALYPSPEWPCTLA